MKQNKETLKQFFETGDKPTQQQYSDLIDSYIDAKQPEGEANRRFVIDEAGEVSVASEQQVPEYSLSPISGTNTVDLLKDGVSVSQIDLTPYLDNTNLARLVSGTVDTNGLATFTRDDNSTFTVDLSNLKDSVPQYQAGTNITIDYTDPENPVINSIGVNSTLQNFQEVLDNGNIFDSDIIGNDNSAFRMYNNGVIIDKNPVNNEGKNVQIMDTHVNVSSKGFTGNDNTSTIMNGLSIVATDNTTNGVIKEAAVSPTALRVSELASISLSASTITKSYLDFKNQINSSTDVFSRYNVNNLTLSSNGNEFKIVYPYDELYTSEFNTKEEAIVFPFNSGTVALTADIPQIQAGSNITIDNTDPLQPIINASGGSMSITEGSFTPTFITNGSSFSATVYGADYYIIGDRVFADIELRNVSSDGQASGGNIEVSLSGISSLVARHGAVGSVFNKTTKESYNCMIDWNSNKILVPDNVLSSGELLLSINYKQGAQSV